MIFYKTGNSISRKNSGPRAIMTGGILISFQWVSLVVAHLLALVIIALFTYSAYKKRVHLTAALRDQMRKNAELSNFLNFFSRNLRTVGKISDAMDLTAKYVSDLINAKAVCVFEVTEQNFLRAAGISGTFPPLHKTQERGLTKSRYIIESLRHAEIKIGEGIIGDVAQTQEGVFLADASQDERLAAANKVVPIDTLMAVPMLTEGKLIGVLCAINHGGTPFTQEQYSALTFLGSQVVLAHNIIKVYSDFSNQQRIVQELEFTRQLQSSLLPRTFPEWEPFVIHAFTKSAKEVSGDFYDFVMMDENRLLVVVGDASGKGIPACMMMAMTRSFIRANVERFTTMKDLLKELNANLYRDTDDGRFTTLACCLLDKKEQTIEFARAGHTELLVYGGTGPVRRIRPSGSAVGLLPNGLARESDTIAFTLKPDMSIMIFSDGFSEAVDSEGNEFGIERLRSLFQESCQREGSPQMITETILSAVNAFTEGQQQNDDQTIVIISHRKTFDHGA